MLAIVATHGFAVFASGHSAGHTFLHNPQVAGVAYVALCVLGRDLLVGQVRRGARACARHFAPGEVALAQDGCSDQGRCTGRGRYFGKDRSTVKSNRPPRAGEGSVETQLLWWRVGEVPRKVGIAVRMSVLVRLGVQ